MKRQNIINTIIKKYDYKTYLEIGVWNPGANFDRIRVDHKESVDPRKGFSYTYNMTSDEFFEKEAKNKKYDVIFVDGLHTEEQSYLDIKNSLKHLNKNGFIVVHDCNPTKEFHIRSHEEYLKVGGDWNGTVFRAFINLKKELPNYSCFVIDEDFGCGIITQRPILKNVQEKYEEFISWEHFNKNRKSLIQLITFEEFLKILK